MAHAASIVILKDKMGMMKKLCKKLMEATSKDGLIINDEKTEYMKLSRGDSPWREF